MVDHGEKSNREELETLARQRTRDLLSKAVTDQAGDDSNAFLYAWFKLFKTAQIHALENEACRSVIQSFVLVSNAVLRRDGRISFQTKDGALFINSVKLKLSSEEYALAYDIFEFLEERGMGGFTLEGALDTEAVKRLLQIMIYAPAEQRKYSALEASLRDAQLPFRMNKTLQVSARNRAAAAALERRSYTFLTYSKLVVLFRSLVAEGGTNLTRRRFLVRKITRTIQALVDICREDDNTLLGMASVKSGDAYMPHHAANVAVLSIAIGDKLGLDKVELADLGLAAMLADIGMKGVQPRVVGKKGDLSAPERYVIEQHPLLGVEFLLEEPALTTTLLHSIVVTFEHHANATGKGGYPTHWRTPSLFSRIVAIADAYDSLTTERPWRPARLPDEALGIMMADAGSKFDPILIKIFVNIIGLYPVGTLVRLASGELAVVVYGGEGERATHPIVSLIGADGNPAATIDLATKNGAGQYQNGIIRAENPAKYGLQTSGLLSESAPMV